MSEGKRRSAEELFAAVVTPHRSLAPAGFLLVMAAFGAVSFTAGLVFWAVGAWPVIGFLGLDLVLVWLAFHANYRAARAYEEIALTRERLSVRKVAPDGRAREFAFNPYWTRLLVERRPYHGIVRMRLASGGDRLDIGQLLHVPERESFVAALDDALARARRG